MQINFQLRNKGQQDELFFLIYFNNHLLHVSNRLTIYHQEGVYCTWGCWQVLSPTRKETSYSDQTRDLFNTLPTKLNTLLSPLLLLLQATQKKIQNVVRPTRSPRQQ